MHVDSSTDVVENDHGRVWICQWTCEPNRGFASIVREQVNLEKPADMIVNKYNGKYNVLKKKIVAMQK